MKRKIIALALCSLMSAYVCCGCKSAENESLTESANEQTASTQESNDTANGIPEDVRAKLQAALNAPPIELPADEWTEETVKDAIYISGEKLKEPLTLRDFGEGLEVRNDETLQIKDGKAVAVLTYYGTEIAGCTVKDCNSFEEIYDCPLQFISFLYDNEEVGECDLTNYPIAINGITIGSTFDEIENRLFFMEKDRDIQDTGYGFYTFNSEIIRVSCYYSDEMVSGIMMHFNEK